MSTRASESEPWSQAVNLTEPVNTEGFDGLSTIWHDDHGQSLFFTSNRSGGPGDMDLWDAARTDVGAPCGEPANIG